MCYRKLHNAYYDKKKSETTEAVEVQDKKNNIRTLEEKKSYKYQGILETDTIRQREMKGKSKKGVLQKKKISRNQTLQQKSNQRNKYLGSPPYKIPGSTFKTNTAQRRGNFFDNA